MSGPGSDISTVFGRLRAVLFGVDYEWHLTYVNRTGEALFQRPAEELTGQVIWEVAPAEVTAIFSDHLRHAHEHQETTHFEAFLPWIGGWHEVNLYPSPDGITIFAFDISERRHERERTRLIDTAITQSNEGVLITNANLDPPGPQIVYVNPAFTRITGYAASDVLSKTPRILQGPMTDRAVLDRMRSDLGAGRDFDGELINYRADGSVFVVEMHIAPVRDEAGQITHFVAVQRDTTERKQMEDELRRAREHLELRVHERTLALEQLTDELRTEIAQRKDVDEALAQSEERLRVLCNNTWDIVAIVDHEGIIRYKSPSVERVLGYEPDELLGRNAFEFIHPDDQAITRRANEEISALPEATRTIEVRLRHKDGSWRVTEATGINLLQNRAIGGILIHYHDITPRKRAEEEVRRLSHDLELILAAAGEGIISLDVDGTIKFANPAAARMLGWLPSDLVGRSLHDTGHHSRPDGSRYPSEECPICRVSPAEIIRSGRDEFYWRKDGSNFPIDFVSSIVLVEGQQHGTVVVFRDRTEQRAVEDTIRQSEQRFRMLIENSAGVVDLIDERLNIRYQSASLRRVLGYTPEELLGRGKLDLIHPDDRNLFRQHIGELLVTPGIPRVVEYRILHRDGDYRWVESTGNNLLHESAIGAIIFNYHDITLQQQIREELERRVTERTQELESLAHSIGHDLRAPLRAISGYAAMTLEDFGSQLDPEVRGYIQVMRENAVRMGKLIDALLKFTRLSRTELKISFVDVAALARSAIDELKKTGEYHHAEIIFSQMPLIRGNAELFRQVLLNLLSNAFKFTRPKANPRIEIGAYTQAEEIVYYVRDNGVGFDMQYAHKLFGVFQQLHPPDQFTGTGIGLSLVHRIVTRFGGRVWAEGKVGEGATFYFSLPA